MEPSTLAVPMWLVQILAGTLLSLILGAIGSVFLLFRRVDSNHAAVLKKVGELRQELVGLDGQNGLKGTLKFLRSRFEDHVKESIEQDREATEVATKVEDLRERFAAMEERERNRGIAA